MVDFSSLLVDNTAVGAATPTPAQAPAANLDACVQGVAVMLKRTLHAALADERKERAAADDKVATLRVEHETMKLQLADEKNRTAEAVSAAEGNEQHARQVFDAFPAEMNEDPAKMAKAVQEWRAMEAQIDQFKREYDIPVGVPIFDALGRSFAAIQTGLAVIEARQNEMRGEGNAAAAQLEAVAKKFRFS